MTTLNLDAIDLPRLTVPQRIREAFRLARITLTTGDHVIAEAYSAGMSIGFAGADYAHRSVRENTPGGTR